MELGVVGDAEFCLGFRLVGLRYVFEVEEDGDWEQSVTKAMSEDEVGILVMPSEVIPNLHPAYLQPATSYLIP